MKRAFDIICSSVGLILLSPVFLLISSAIILDSPGPVFFRQERVGRNGIPFRIFKFRSMMHGIRGEGLQITAAGDSRVTRVGRFLRRTKLDELPQLINVWRGEMSLVGPRPEVPAYVALYTKKQKEVLSVRPGITDPASIVYIDEEKILAGVSDPNRTYVEEILPHKLELDLQYIKNMSLTNDIWIIFGTLNKVFG